MNNSRIIAAIMGYKRSSRAVRAFWVFAKRRIPTSYFEAYSIDGRFHHHGKFMTTSAALRHNARLSRFYRSQEHLMRRRPFAFLAFNGSRV